jgi:hypothetical protein
VEGRLAGKEVGIQQMEALEIQVEEEEREREEKGMLQEEEGRRKREEEMKEELDSCLQGSHPSNLSMEELEPERRIVEDRVDKDKEVDLLHPHLLVVVVVEEIVCSLPLEILHHHSFFFVFVCLLYLDIGRHQSINHHAQGEEESEN